MGFDWNAFFQRQGAKLAVRLVLGMATGGLSEAGFLGADLVDAALTVKDVVEELDDVRSAVEDVQTMAQRALADDVVTADEARALAAVVVDAGGEAYDVSTAVQELKDTVREVYADGRQKVTGAEMLAAAKSAEATRLAVTFRNATTAPISIFWDDRGSSRVVPIVRRLNPGSDQIIHAYPGQYLFATEDSGARATIGGWTMRKDCEQVRVGVQRAGNGGIIIVPFHNNSGKVAALHWKDGDGCLRYYNDVNPNQWVDMQTFSGHAWVAKDKSSSAVLGEWIVRDDGASISIGNPHQRFSVTFKNQTRKTLSLFWNNEGRQVFYREIPPSGTCVPTTFVGHQWDVLDSRGSTKSSWILTGEIDVITIGDHEQLVQVAFKNKTANTVSLFWDMQVPGKKEIYYYDIKPAAIQEVQAYYGHKWVARDIKGLHLGTWHVYGHEGTIAIF